jgi:hypothetical protein
MRHINVVALIALAVLPAGAGDASAQSRKPNRSRPEISRCIKLTQDSVGDSGLELSLANSCRVPVACTLSWQLVCENQGETRRRTRANVNVRLAVEDGETGSTLADASSCRGESWAIRRVKWSCEQADSDAAE